MLLPAISAYVLHKHISRPLKRKSVSFGLLLLFCVPSKSAAGFKIAENAKFQCVWLS